MFVVCRWWPNSKLQFDSDWFEGGLLHYWEYYHKKNISPLTNITAAGGLVNIYGIVEHITASKQHDPEIGAPRQGRLHSSEKNRILKLARPGRGACTARKKPGPQNWRVPAGAPAKLTKSQEPEHGAPRQGHLQSSNNSVPRTWIWGPIAVPSTWI